MAYATERTLIPLDRVAKILQITPWHFAGIVGPQFPARNAADDFWLQHDWFDHGKASRESLAVALKQAEDTVLQYLGYSPLPDWFIDEPHNLPRPAVPEQVFVSEYNSMGQPLTIEADHGYFIEGGHRAVSLIEANASITYTDPDGDGLKELATITVNLPVPVPINDEICVFYPGKGGAPEWEIRPVAISSVSGVATITFNRWQTATEEANETPPNADTGDDSYIDGEDDTLFLTAVDVYRVYNDPSSQMLMYSANSCLSCGGSGCAACGYVAETGCIAAHRDPRMSILRFQRADWDATTSAFAKAEFSNGRLPDYCKISYRAGLMNQNRRLPTREMDPSWERLISFYAVLLLDTEIGWTDNTKRIYSYWIEDLSFAGGDDSRSIPERVLNNPLGTHRVEVYIWNKIMGPKGRLSKAR